MRTVTASITAAETGGALKPATTVTASNELLSFASFTTQTNALLDTAIPQSYGAGVTWRTTDGKAYARSFTRGTAAEWALSTAGATQIDGAGAATQYHAMRYAVISATTFIAPVHNGSGVQLYDIDTFTAGASTFGPVFGPDFSDTSSLVCRVEAVCYSGLAGHVVVAVGTHNFTLQLTTIEFWHVTSAAAVQLDSIIQYDLSDTYSHWHSCAKWASFITAIYDSANLSIRVIANAHPDGKSVTFTIKNGVESMIRPVVPIDPEYGSITFRASTLTKIDDLYYLTGRLTYSFDDGSTQAFDCYLTSLDGDLWSIGERSFYLHASDSCGTVLLDTSPSPDVLYYGGNLVVSVATATPVQGVNTATMQEAVVMMPGGSLSQIGNGAHSLQFNVANPTGAYSDNSNVTRGSVLYLEKGQWGATSQVGVYSIDSVNAMVTEKGRSAAVIRARDIASKALIRHNAPVDIEYAGMDSMTTNLADKTGLVLKTRDSDVLVLDSSNPSGDDVTQFDAIMGASGLLHKGLNNPLVALVDVNDAPDIFLKATVECPDTGDDYALSQFVFVWGAEDSDVFRAVAVPKDNSWSSKAKPRVMASNIRPYDSTDDSGGFTFPKRMQALWNSNNVGDDAYLQALAEVASHYVTEFAHTQTAGTKRDYALRVSGRRVQLFSHLHDYGPTTMADNAGWTTYMEYLYTSDERLVPKGKSRVGFAVDTDAWALQTAFAHAAYADVETGLTTAITHNAKTYYATSGMPPDVGHFEMPSPSSVNHLACTGTTFNNAYANVDLSAYYYVGQTIWWTGMAGTGGGARAITGWVTNGVNAKGGMTLSASTLQNATAMLNWIRSGVSWAECASGVKAKSVTGGTVWVDPNPKRVTGLMTGLAAFAGNDATALVYQARWVDSDGVTHLLLSGGWDGTNPVADASAWKMIFHHNAIGKFRASVDYDLPTHGRMLIENEIVRYTETVIDRWDSTLGVLVPNTQWLTYIPTYYGAPALQTAAALRIHLYNASGSGDDWAAITDAAGLHCEVTGRSGMASGDVPSVYLTGVGNDGVAYIEIDTMPAGPILETDYVTISGRGQLGTKKNTHASDAPVCYYPVPAVGGTRAESFVTVSSFSARTGVRHCVEDAIKYLCASAGMRDAAFRNLLDTAYVKTPWTHVVTTTPTVIPTNGGKQYADFVLDMDVHIPDVTGLLAIGFRGYYRLLIAQETSAAGELRLLLDAPNDTRITAGAGGRLLQWADVNISNGVTMCAAYADNAHVRLTVIGDSITVTINEKHVWTFDLGEMVHTDGTSYNVQTAGDIVIYCYGPMSGNNNASIRLLELWPDATPIQSPVGTNTAQTIKRICDRWGITSRATQTGGIEFSTFTSRDNAGTLTASLKDHGHTGDDAKSVGHVMVTGRQSGAFIDATHITADGYSFQVSSNSDAQTVQESAEAAQVIARESVEFAAQETITATMRIADEVEDMKTLAYAPGNGAPSFATDDFVITALNWTFGEKMDTAKYNLRKYQEWQ